MTPVENLTISVIHRTIIRRLRQNIGRFRGNSEGGEIGRLRQNIERLSEDFIIKSHFHFELKIFQHFAGFFQGRTVNDSLSAFGTCIGNVIRNYLCLPFIFKGLGFNFLFQLAGSADRTIFCFHFFSDHLPPGHRQNPGRQPLNYRAGVQQ